ncbi:hypothetical protein [Bradyrhizobium guangzhouense]|uniref:hypothetical protein n=1 Tax=Bradyrhizobium guangzhouense TaxID=1325095 RepID=UPI001009D90E|nr:hypothetical protein [Bradyrhizobium guangzhouense]RXH10869.1 hypothetical protein EAS54_30685 [Bradyrhizobium guangzhouense]
MPDAEMTALLQAVLDEVCAELPPWDTTTRERVAERLRNLVRSGRSSVDELKRAGRDALIRAPTMWP